MVGRRSCRIRLRTLISLSLLASSRQQAQTPTGISAEASRTVHESAAILTYTNPAGIVVSRAGVNPTEPLKSGLIFVDQTGPTTGITLANPSDQSASPTLILRDESGRETARRTLDLAAKQDSDVTISELFPGLPDGFRGTLAFESDQPLAGNGFRENINAYGESILSSVPAVDSASPLSAEPLVLPHIAAAGGTTDVVLVNTADQRVRGTIRLIGPSGKPLAMRLSDHIGSQFGYEIEAGGVYRGRFESLSAGAAGYAIVTPNDGDSTPTGMLIFQATSGRGLVSEAIVAVNERPTTSARVFVDNATARTGFAIANPNLVSTTVSFALLDANGTAVGKVTTELAPRGYSAVFANELFPQLVDGFEGLLDITAPLPVVPISLMVALNERNDPILTSLDIVDLDHPLESQSLVFPQTSFGLQAAARLIAIEASRDSSAGVILTLSQLDSTQLHSLSLSGSANQSGSQSGKKPVAFAPGNAPRLSVAATCDPLLQNPIMSEYQLTGNPQIEWDVTGAGDSSIQGFASEISVNKGETVFFKVSTPSTSYRLDIYRLGYYAGAGARKITTVNPSVVLPQNQPACLTDSTTGLIDCGNWAVSASWAVPLTAVSGVHIAKLVRQDGSTVSSHIVFIVRDDASTSDLLFQTSDTTWQAYNSYGGNSFYTGSPASRAFKISYNRPFNTRVTNTNSWLFGAEYPMIRFLEANGYNVTYFTDIDTDRRASLLLQHKVFLSVGHDEYWSAAQRTNVENARAAAINLAFFSGNAVFWKTRWENSIDGSNSPYKTLVCYKETHANAKIDPTPVWTGTWRDPRFSPPADGGRPSNSLKGTLFSVNGPRSDAIAVPSTYAPLRFWRNTTVASLSSGQTATFPVGTLGYEWDEAPDGPNAPPGLVTMSSTTLDVSPSYLLNYGSTFGSGIATHQLTLYKHSSGALVFSAGTVQWAWGLDNIHDGSAPAPDVRMQQATINLFADMRAQPLTLQSGLVAATASTDTVAPSSTITSPATGAAFSFGSTLTITGTAADTGGGVVGTVEVSTDGGVTWRRATGRQSWSYTWTAYTSGSINIKSRAADDSGNLQVPGAGINVTVAAPLCPSTTVSCFSLWNSSATPTVASANDASSAEVGVKFKSDVNGYVTAVRFYKGTQNTGNHIVNLWTSAGTLMATAPTVNETASGWQQANFASPVAVTANTTYVASYFTPTGFYSYSRPYLTSGFDNAPLHALADVASGGNGVYRYGVASGFPTSAYQASNFWVDVFFTTATPSDTTPPVISAVQSAGVTSNGATITWSTNEASDSQVEYGTTTSYGLSTPVDSNLVLSHSQQLSGLTAGTLYHYRVKSKDASGNLAVSADFTFSTPAGCSCDVSLWNNSPTPGSSTDGRALEIGVKFKSDVNGYIKAIKFYKGPQNTGSHTANLWTSTGTQLGQALSSGETATGWQTVNFSSPIAITANTVYVASYFTTSGFNAVTNGYFTSGFDNAPLHALSDASAGGNGLYRFGSTSGFPNSSYQASNYWVDVVFATTIATDTTPPVISSVQAGSITTTTATITWTTDEASDSQVDYGTTASYGSSTPLNSSSVTSHSQQITGLTAGTLYHYRVRSRDAAGNTANSSDLTFSTTADTTAPVISSVQAGSITATSTTITWSTDEASDSQVEYGTTISYGLTTTLNSTLVTSHSQPLTGLAGGTLYHYRVKSKDAAGNLAVSADFTFTTIALDTTPPVVSNVQAVSITTTSATVTWSTDEASDTQVDYGTTISYGSSTTLNSSLVTSHSQPLASLTSGTLYHYRVRSKDAAGNLTVSADFTFTTTAADVTPPVISGVQAGSITAAAATITWNTDEASDSQVDYGTTTGYGSSTTLNASLVTSHSQQLTSLTTGTLYHYRVRSKDAAGNTAVSADFTFTTLASCNCDVSLWTTSITPGNSTDSRGVEVGVKFKSDVNGFIKAIRFYKASQSTGPHTVSLWSSTGALLGQAQTTSETASGWQTVNFATPIAITANTVYVASTFSPSGYNAQTVFYFNSGFDNPPLHAPDNGSSGGNGVYRFGTTAGFPTSSYQASNYWVDVIFATSIP